MHVIALQTKKKHDVSRRLIARAVHNLAKKAQNGHTKGTKIMASIRPYSGGYRVYLKYKSARNRDIHNQA